MQRTSWTGRIEQRVHTTTWEGTNERWADCGSVVVQLAALLIFLGLLGVVSRRLLGVRIGSFRILLAAIIALGVEFGFESQVVWEEPERRWVFIPIQIGITVGAALAVLVVAELLVASGSWPRPDKWFTSVRSWAARTRTGGLAYSSLY